MASIIKWNPFDDLDKFFDDEFFSSKRGKDLAVDLYEEGNSLIAKMHVPGIDAKDINVSVEDNYLVVSGKREEEKEEKEKNFYRKEIKSGSFERIIALPKAVKSDQVSAELKNGVLKVVMPKQEEEGGKRVEVQVKD